VFTVTLLLLFQDQQLACESRLNNIGEESAFITIEVGQRFSLERAFITVYYSRKGFIPAKHIKLTKGKI